MFIFSLDKQRLYLEPKSCGIKSIYAVRLEKELNKTLKCRDWGIIAHSVTESIMIESRVKNNDVKSQSG